MFFRIGKRKEEVVQCRLTECLDEQCIYALSIGMPYDLFWHGELDAFFLFAKGYEERIKRENEISDLNNFMMGRYFRDALLDVCEYFNLVRNPKPTGVFPEKPYIMKHREDEEKTDEERLLESQMKLYKNLSLWAAGHMGGGDRK